ncbi:hypothetical protein NA56DRAFT_699733 [Hyaloscypha hepaticicola]|uniref:Uncharacterized protein n=1 Tax=Hyaloscypha hepaticicola TaxID=2082293 RepID=A0A2J6QF87_9HELO|nr:hypothetical protein NA56DRAFT_699733 [Hyaloscypha hepaticicola]
MGSTRSIPASFPSVNLEPNPETKSKCKCKVTNARDVRTAGSASRGPPELMSSGVVSWRSHCRQATLGVSVTLPSMSQLHPAVRAMVMSGSQQENLEKPKNASQSSISHCVFASVKCDRTHPPHEVLWKPRSIQASSFTALCVASAAFHFLPPILICHHPTARYIIYDCPKKQ